MALVGFNNHVLMRDACVSMGVLSAGVLSLTYESVVHALVENAA